MGATTIGAARTDGDAWRVALLAGLAVAALVSTVLTVGLGAVAIPPGTVLGIVREAVAPTGAAHAWSMGQQHIILDLRIPRAILAALVGAGLGLVGSVLQGITRNPLADPYLFGVSSGAAVGAVSVILYTGSVLGVLTLPLAAFAGALLAMAAVFLLAREGGGFSTERLVLTGVAVHFVFSACTNMLIYNANDRGADAALFWMLGSFGNARWNVLAAPAVALVAGGAWILYRARALDALSLGDEGAHTLGVRVKALRLEMFVASALMTGIFVSTSGTIGFVGLIVPHVARWAVGAQMRWSLPTAAGFGAVFTVWVDAASRYALAPKELPFSVMTAAVGGVFFTAILRRRRTA